MLPVGMERVEKARGAFSKPEADGPRRGRATFQQKSMCDRFSRTRCAKVISDALVVKRISRDASNVVVQVRILARAQRAEIAEFRD